MIFILAVFAILALLYIHFIWNFDYWSKRGVPSPKPKFILGDLPNIVLRQKNVAYDMEKVYNDFKAKSPFVGIIQISEPRLFVMDPELIKDIFIRKFNNFRQNEFVDTIDVKNDPLFEKNVFFLKDEEWKAKRAEITPAFSTNRLKSFYPLIQDVLLRMIKFVNDNSKSQPFDTRELCAKYTTDVVSNCIFGIDAESFTRENAEIRKMAKNIFAETTPNMIKAILVSFFPFLGKFVKITFSLPETQRFFVDLMEQALKYREEQNIQREDFLDYVIQLRNKKNISSIDMSSHCISFFSDGIETSSISISNALYELAKNNRVQDKLREEVKKNFDENGQIDFEALTECKYLDQVFHEALRLHPPAPFTTRICTESTELEYDGKSVKIDKGTCVYIPILQVHTDSNNFLEPAKFYPERFDDGAVKGFMDRCSFLPFGAGPRICLGMRFAVLQSKAVIATLIRNFELSVDKKTQDNPLLIDPKAFLNIKQGELWLNFKVLKN